MLSRWHWIWRHERLKSKVLYSFSLCFQRVINTRQYGAVQEVSERPCVKLWKWGWVYGRDPKMLEVQETWDICERQSLHKEKKQSKEEMESVGRNARGLKWSKSFDTGHGFTACPPGLCFFCVSEFHNYGSIFHFEMVIYILYHYMLEVYNRFWFDFDFIIFNHLNTVQNSRSRKSYQRLNVLIMIKNYGNLWSWVEGILHYKWPWSFEARLWAVLLWMRDVPYRFKHLNMWSLVLFVGDYKMFGIQRLARWSMPLEMAFENF